MKWAAVFLLIASTAAADPKDPLQFNYAVDGTIAGTATVAWLSSEVLFKSSLAPVACRWCADDGFDRAVRDDLKWSNTHTADVLSNVDAFGFMPLAALGGVALAAAHDGAGKNIPGDVLVIAEATALAQDMNQLVKFSVGRERPFVHALPDSQKTLTDHPDDNNLSFFSGHSSWAFTLATAAGTISSMHGYKLAPVVWGAGLTFATLTGVLRIGADKHYATDVIAGALIGSAVGIGVPRLFHPVQTTGGASQQQYGLSAQATPGGALLGLSGHF